MQKSVAARNSGPASATAPEATFSIVLALSFAHFLNDMMQSLLPAIYPIIKDAYGLDFGQIGLITLAFQLTASLLQPVVGMITDRRPQPYSTGRGHGLHVRRPDRAGARGELSDAAGGRGADRHGVVGLPPRIDAHGAAGLRRPARVRPVAVPGRRAGGPGARAAACGLHRGAARAGEHLLVLAGGAVRHGACCCRSAPGTSASRRSP